MKACSITTAKFRRRDLPDLLALKALARAFVGVGRCRTVLAAMGGSRLNMLRIGMPANAHVIGLGRGRGSIFHGHSVQLERRRGFVSSWMRRHWLPDRSASQAYMKLVPLTGIEPVF